jgi:hypothetical protein
MIEAFYVLLLSGFCVLIVAALTRYLLNVSVLREDMRQQQERHEQQGKRLDRTRRELEEVELDLQLLEMEVEALEQQEICMRSLDQFNAAEDVSDNK